MQNNDAQDNATACGNFLPRTTTSALLNLAPGQQITAAYLYWSGVGSFDGSVQLNGIPISRDRCWQVVSRGPSGNSIDVFNAFSDVTSLVQNAGNGVYTFTGLNNTALYTANNCRRGPNGSVLYGGWALVVFYEDNTTAGDYTVYLIDGFRGFQNERYNTTLRTNVFDDYENSHVGVIAWEGDDYNFAGDSQDYFRLNNQILPSDGYDSPDNIFNGTNSFVSPVDRTFYNGDIDDFDASNVVRNLLNTEAATFNFELKTGQDVVFLSTLIFRIPNRAPDATVQLPLEFSLACDERTFNLDFTYKNEDYASQELAQNTPIRFYLEENMQVIGQTVTGKELQVGESDSGTVTLSLPSDYLGDFTVLGIIDDPALGSTDYGTILELFEENNTSRSRSFIDKSYSNLQFTENLCEGDSYQVNGQTITTNGTFGFQEKTVRGGCDSTGQVTVIFNPNYDITVPLETVCEGNAITRPSGMTQILPPAEEIYEFTDNLKSRYGCDSVVHSLFKVLPNQRATVNPQICIGENFILPDSTSVDKSGEYVVTLPGRAANGCDSIVTTQLDVLDVEYPNAFGPDGNGVNEGFKALIPTICPNYIKTYDLKVFNRWGELVFQTNKVEDAWDGNFNNALSKQDFYIWYVTFTTEDNNTITKKGGVTLVR